MTPTMLLSAALAGPLCPAGTMDSKLEQFATTKLQRALELVRRAALAPKPKRRQRLLVKATVPLCLALALLDRQLAVCLFTGTLLAQLGPGRAFSKLGATLLLKEELAVSIRVIGAGTGDMLLLCDTAPNAVVRLNGTQA
jgi:hypothetical protein